MHHHHPPAQTQQRRRKKRPNYGIRTVEVSRGYNGFGFTISGQQPCRVSCSVANSPADKAGLRAGDFLISVNNLNVSKLPHETVVKLIGNSLGSIRMQIAENYFSDSSDEENALLLQAGGASCSANGGNSTRMKPRYLHHKMKMNRLRNSPQKIKAKAMAGVGGSSVTNTATRGLRPVIEDIPLLALASQPCRSKSPPAAAPTATAYDVIPKVNAVISNDISNVSAMVRIPARQPQHAALEYRAIVGYLGTIEMPRQISNSSKLQTVRSCIRKLRQEKRQPTTVLMTILPDFLRLQAANGNILATYTAARLNYVSSSSESENRFFGLVTSAIHTMQADDDEQVEDEEDVPNPELQIRNAAAPSSNNISISNSCHVFVIDTKLCEHVVHLERAREFRIECTNDPISSLCLEFPNNSEYVVNLIRSMYTMRLLPPATRHSAEFRGMPHEAAQAHSPQPSNHSEVSTTTSNSDSGIGFYNDCTNISDRILVVDFPAAQILAGVAPPRLARPLGIFNNIDVVPAMQPAPKLSSTIDSDKRLTVRAMPDPKTQPLPRINAAASANVPNLLESFKLIRSPASSLTATRSCDDVLALMERTPEQTFSLTAASSCLSLHQQQQRHKSMQMSMDDISLHSTSQLYAQSIEVTEPAQEQPPPHTFLQPANIALHSKRSDGQPSYALLQDCRAGVRSSLHYVPSKLSPKVYGVPTATITQCMENDEEKNGKTILLRSRRSFSHRNATRSGEDDFGSWSSLQDLHCSAMERSSFTHEMAAAQLEATNSEPDLGNRALPSNASPFRRAWGQSSFRTPRADKNTQQLQQQNNAIQQQSPLVRRTASMTASDNDVYIKSMDTYIDNLKQSRSQQQIAGDSHKSSKANNCSFSAASAAAAASFCNSITTALANNKPAVVITSSLAGSSNNEQAVVGPVGVAAWGTSFERLLEDPAGLHTFAEFLKKEFSAENIYFWTACERFRHLDNESERATQAMAIFSKHLANGSLEPVNVDSQARNLTEEKLQSAEPDIFAQAQKQIFNLMKFDSYQRFIRSDMYKSCLEAEAKNLPLPYTAEDLDELLKTNFHQAASASKLKKSASNAEDRRRKSLLPWHRKTRCKSRDRAETDIGYNKLSSIPAFHAPSKLPLLSSSSSLKIPSTQNSMSDIHSSRSSLSSFDTLPGSTITMHSNGAQVEEIKPCTLCRVILSDGATTIVQTRAGDTVGQLVERLLEKRGLSYAFYDVVINGSTKSIDLQSPAVQMLAGKEVVIEQRVAFKLDLPDPKVISVKSKPKKQLHEVIRPILQKYNYCMDTVQVLLRDTHEQLDLSLPVTVADGQRLQIVLIKAPPPPPHCSDFQNGLHSVGKTNTKHSLPKSVSFPNTKSATTATRTCSVGTAAVAAGASVTVNPHQSTLDEITNKVFNELLQSKVEAHLTQQQQQQLPLTLVPADLCSLKSDDCASETSSVFDRMRRRDSNVPGMKLKPKKKPFIASSSQSDETISINTPLCSVEPNSGVEQIPANTAAAACAKKPIIAKLKAGVRLQVTERVAENQDELLEGLKRAQLARLEDQRGTEINFELPDFLKNKENLSAANKLRKVRANLSPVSKSLNMAAASLTFEEPPSPHSALALERPQPAPRLSITNKTSRTNSSPMKIDEEDDALEQKHNNNNNVSNSSTLESDYASTKGPPPLPPKPKVLPIKPSNWGVTSSSNVNKLHSTSFCSNSAASTNMINNNAAPTSPAIQLPSKIPIDIGRKHLGSEQTGRCAYLEEPSSSFV